MSTLSITDIGGSIRIKDVPNKVIVPNPGNREVTISSIEKGLVYPQLFISSAFPDEIPYKFLRFVKSTDGRVYPKYISEAVSEPELWLNGFPCYENGIEIINRICKELTQQKGLREAKSVTRSDLMFFDYKKEKLTYWLASPGVYGYYPNNHFGPGNVIEGITDSGYGTKIFKSKCFISGGLPVRPTMVLDVEVIR